MGLKLITPPAVEPISTAEAKAQTRLEISDDDTIVGNKIVSARQYCEKFHHRSYVTQTWRLTLDGFPCNMTTVGINQWSYHANGCIQLPRPPLQSVTSVKYYDLAGVQQTLDSSLYLVDADSEPGRLCPSPSQHTWPATQPNRMNAVEIIYVAGYGNAAAVPQDLKEAIAMMAAHLYENREATTTLNLKPTPMAVESILMQYGWGAYG